MPIFHEYREHPPPGATPEADTGLEEISRPRTSSRKNTPELGSRSNGEAHRSNPVAVAAQDGRVGVLSRRELIQRIKRGDSPSWPSQQDRGRPVSSHGRTTPRTTPPRKPDSPLLPAAELKEITKISSEPTNDQEQLGLQIERPRSALHSGDFRQEQSSSEYENERRNNTLATSPVAPWHQDFPKSIRPYGGEVSEGRFPFRESIGFDSRPVRSRATSQASLSSSFVFMPPTSPLVQQSNNTDLDFSPKYAHRQGSRSPDPTNRRHTFSPHSFQTFRSSQFDRPGAQTAARSPASLRRERTFPYQAHQPRRSVSSMVGLQAQSTPQTPLLRPRRPSISDSPLHHAPMVGSYEESILRGRMSTTPSRPLNFVAQIGVLGKGNCKANLRCPPHVTVPFPAVFYSYGTGGGKIDDQPSPYVGLVDLENSLSAPERRSDSRRRRRHTTPSEHDDLDARISESEGQAAARRRKSEKMKRRSVSPKTPPGGSYRIPQQGQLQIVLKNPNKTAVKLFLVPYDLSDMEPGQKTFIRQRSYSAGPIIDMPLTSRKNFGTDRPEASLSNSDDPNDRPILRYLIHLHICCTGKGRYFLYKSIRVVFANRVPDGKEKLRNEIQLPDPRYSTYKPVRSRELNPATQHAMAGASATLQADKARRRRTADFSFGSVQQPYDGFDGFGYRPNAPSPPPFTFGSASRASDPANIRIPPVPFNLSRLETVESRPVSRDQMDIDDPTSPLKGKSTAGQPMRAGPIYPGPAWCLTGGPGPSSCSSLFGSPMSPGEESYDKLNKGDAGYGGSPLSGMSSPGAGLLARRLREFSVKREEEEESACNGSA